MPVVRGIFQRDFFFFLESVDFIDVRFLPSRGGEVVVVVVNVVVGVVSVTVTSKMTRSIKEIVHFAEMNLDSWFGIDFFFFEFWRLTSNMKKRKKRKNTPSYFHLPCRRKLAEENGSKQHSFRNDNHSRSKKRRTNQSHFLDVSERVWTTNKKNRPLEILCDIFSILTKRCLRQFCSSYNRFYGDEIFLKKFSQQFFPEDELSFFLNQQNRNEKNRLSVEYSDFPPLFQICMFNTTLMMLLMEKKKIDLFCRKKITSPLYDRSSYDEGDMENVEADENDKHCSFKKGSFPPTFRKSRKPMPIHEQRLNFPFNDQISRKEKESSLKIDAIHFPDHYFSILKIGFALFPQYFCFIE